MVATVAVNIPIGLLCAGKGRPRGAYGEYFRAPAPSPVDSELSLSTGVWRLRFPLRLISRFVELPIGEEADLLRMCRKTKAAWALRRPLYSPSPRSSRLAT